MSQLERPARGTGAHPLPTAALVLSLGLLPAACATDPGEAEVADEALAQVLVAHGWECDAIRDYRSLDDGWLDVRCVDGRSYAIRLGPAWAGGAGERRTALRPLLDVARHARGLGAPAAAERIGAAHALAALGERSAPATGALVAALDDPDSDVRAAAIEALGAIGPGAESATGRLSELAAEAEPPLAAAAREALGRIMAGGE